MAIYNSKYIYEAAGACNAGVLNLRTVETSQMRQSAKRLITVGEEHQIYFIIFHSNSLAMAIYLNTLDNISPTQKTLTKSNFRTAPLMLISGCNTVADVSSQPTPSSTAKHSTREENHKPCVRNGRHSTARPFEWKWFWNGKIPAELRSSCVIYALSIKCNDYLMVWTHHQISRGLPHQTR